MKAGPDHVEDLVYQKMCPLLINITGNLIVLTLQTGDLFSTPLRELSGMTLMIGRENANKKARVSTWVLPEL